MYIEEAALARLSWSRNWLIYMTLWRRQFSVLVWKESLLHYCCCSYVLLSSILHRVCNYKAAEAENWRCVGGGDGAHRKDLLNFVSKEDKVKSYVIVSTELSCFLLSHIILKKSIQVLNPDF